MTAGRPALLAFAVIALAACKPSAAVTSFEPESGPVQALDGATVRVDGETLRLAGIDVARLAPYARCWAEALLAREALEALSLELSAASDVEVVPALDGAGDRVRVYARGKDLSQLMIERGFAVATEGRWNWCGPVDPASPRAPRLNYPAGAGGAPRSG